MMKTRRMLFAAGLAVCLFAGGVAALPAPGWAPEGSPVDKHGRLKITGNKLTSSKTNETVVLRGVSFGWSSNIDHERPFYQKKVVGWLAYDWRVSVVRAALGVGDKGNENGPWKSPGATYGKDNNPTANIESNRSAVERVIDGAIESGIYVIIDWHSHWAHSEKNGDHGSIEFFKYMANKYKDYPNVIYEIYNEPINTSWSDIKSYAEDVISEIRKIDPNNIIIVGTPFYSQEVDKAVANPISSNNRANVMYTLHFYCEHTFTNQASQSVPTFVTEFGLSRSNGDDWCTPAPSTTNVTGDTSYMKSWFNAMDANSLSWAAWQISTRGERSAFLKNSSGSTTGTDVSLTSGNWDVTRDLTDGGRWMRSKLHSYHTTAPRPFRVAIDKTGEGTISGGGNNFGFCADYTVTATPTEGMRFEGWLVGGGYGGNTNPLKGEACSDVAATAVFIRDNLIPQSVGTFIMGVPVGWGNAAGRADNISVDNMEGVVTAANYGTGRNDALLRHPQNPSGTSSLTLTQGRRYRLEFRARAESGTRKITPAFVRGSARYNDTASVQLVSDWREYWMEFDMTVAASGSTALVFYYGGEQGGWRIDDVYLFNKSAATGEGTTGNHRDETSSIALQPSAVRPVNWSLTRAGGSLTLRGPAEAGSKATLYDVRGKAVRTVNAIDGMTLGFGLPTGNYFVVVRNAAGKDLFRDRALLVR